MRRLLSVLMRHIKLSAFLAVLLLGFSLMFLGEASSNAATGGLAPQAQSHAVRVLSPHYLSTSSPQIMVRVKTDKTVVTTAFYLDGKLEQVVPAHQSSFQAYFHLSTYGNHWLRVSAYDSQRRQIGRAHVRIHYKLSYVPYR